jgi:hypothetical protein
MSDLLAIGASGIKAYGQALSVVAGGSPFRG